MSQCPKCGCQVEDPFTGKIIVHDVERCGSLAVVQGSGLHWPCECRNWCRSDIRFENGKPLPMTNHHPRCQYVDETLIDVWRVSYDGSSYVTDRDPADEPEILCGDEIITKDRMHREIYQHLPDFLGF